MRPTAPNLLPLLALVFWLAACGTTDEATEATVPAGPTPAAAAPGPAATAAPPVTSARTREGMAEDEFMIGEGSVLGLRPGQPIADVANTTKDILRTGEGDFTIYRLADAAGKPLGYLAPHPERTGEISTIHITDPTFVTPRGISVGDTFGELRAAYGAVTPHGSEIEGRTGVTVGRTHFVLDARHWDYNLAPGTIGPATRITEIVVR